jgi:NADPH:quinone reductase-like Zn-dependent oxidoreductase
VVISKRGGPDVLRLEERPEPVAGAGETIVEVRAAGVNFADVLARVGLYPDAPPLPAVVGYEVAGVVAGSDERVIAPTRFGGYAERVAVKTTELFPLPGDLSFAEGASIPVVYSTAWTALARLANVQPGERVVVHAAAGGVGLAAVQIATCLGAYVIGACSPAKQAAVLEQGAAEVHGYDLAGVAAVDVVLDALGGSSLRRSYGMLRAGGRLVSYGVSALVTGERRNMVRAAPQFLRMVRGFNVADMIERSRAVIGLNTLRLWDQAGTLRPWLEPAMAMICEHHLRPVIAAEIPLERAADAHRILGERRNIGKVVLIP